MNTNEHQIAKPIMIADNDEPESKRTNGKEQGNETEANTTYINADNELMSRRIENNRVNRKLQGR